MRMFRYAWFRLPPLALLATVHGLRWEAQASEPVRFTVWPAATGQQVVRASLPLPSGFLATNQACIVRTGKGRPEPAAVRVLSGTPQLTLPPTPPAARS